MSKTTPTAKAAAAATKVELTPTTARMYFNHEECSHASTPAARAKCRKDGPAATFRADNGITRLTVVPAQGEAPAKPKKAKAAKVAEAGAVLEQVVEAITAAQPKVKKSKKSKVATEPSVWVGVHSHTGDTVIHWAREVDGTLAPACGNKLTSPVRVEVTEARNCQKCRVLPVEVRIAV